MTKKSIGELITKTLEEKKVSTYAVFVGSGVQVNVLRRMQAGNANYTVDSLFKVLDFLGLELNIKEKTKE